MHSCSYDRFGDAVYKIFKFWVEKCQVMNDNLHSIFQKLIFIYGSCRRVTIAQLSTLPWRRKRLQSTLSLGSGTVHHTEGDSLYLPVLPCTWKSKKYSNSTIITITRILIQISVMTAPLYLLVVTYAVVKLLLHVTERFLRMFGLFVDIWLLLWYDVCLSDIQQFRSELFQLTAGYTH
jgi:hypothetical protein